MNSFTPILLSLILLPGLALAEEREPTDRDNDRDGRVEERETNIETRQDERLQNRVDRIPKYTVGTGPNVNMANPELARRTLDNHAREVGLDEDAIDRLNFVIDDNAEELSELYDEAIAARERALIQPTPGNRQAAQTAQAALRTEARRTSNEMAMQVSDQQWKDLKRAMSYERTQPQRAITPMMVFENNAIRWNLSDEDLVEIQGVFDNHSERFEELNAELRMLNAQTPRDQAAIDMVKEEMDTEYSQLHSELAQVTTPKQLEGYDQAMARNRHQAEHQGTPHNQTGRRTNPAYARAGMPLDLLAENAEMLNLSDQDLANITRRAEESREDMLIAYETYTPVIAAARAPDATDADRERAQTARAIMHEEYRDNWRHVLADLSPSQRRDVEKFLESELESHSRRHGRGW